MQYSLEKPHTKHMEGSEEPKETAVLERSAALTGCRSLHVVLTLDIEMPKG